MNEAQHPPGDIGKHYAGNMLAITLTGALRTRELLHVPRVHVMVFIPSRARA